MPLQKISRLRSRESDTAGFGRRRPPRLRFAPRQPAAPGAAREQAAAEGPIAAGHGSRTTARRQFHAREAIRRRDVPAPDIGDGLILAEDELAVEAVAHTHGIPSLSMQESLRINVWRTALDQFFLPVGPWLDAAKTAIRAGACVAHQIAIPGHSDIPAEFTAAVDPEAPREDCEAPPPSAKSRTGFADGAGAGWFLGEEGGQDFALARGYGGRLIAVGPRMVMAITSDPSQPARSKGYFGELLNLVREALRATA